MTALSLELFPDLGKSDEKIIEMLNGFVAGSTDFVSVTCTQNEFNHTLALCKLLRENGYVPAAHLLCCNKSKDELATNIKQMSDCDIGKVVALRGDQAISDQAFATQDLVELLAKDGGFKEICVAGYPDVHPDAQSSFSDLDYLKKKVDAGATRIITQFSFDAQSLRDFRERITKKAINVPISVGLLPIRNYTKMLSFAERCRAMVPSRVREQFEEAPAENHSQIATSILSNLTCELVEDGFDIHFYALNSSNMINEAWLAASKKTRTTAVA